MGIYLDFYMDLVRHPITNDVAVKTDEDAVRESIKNLLLTDRGERLFQPNLGSDIRATLFESNTPATLTILKQRVLETIANHEPRCTVIDVQLNSDFDDNTVNIKITFYVRSKEVPISMTVFLERVR